MLHYLFDILVFSLGKISKDTFYFFMLFNPPNMLLEFYIIQVGKLVRKVTELLTTRIYNCTLNPSLIGGCTMRGWTTCGGGDAWRRKRPSYQSREGNYQDGGYWTALYSRQHFLCLSTITSRPFANLQARLTNYKLAIYSRMHVCCWYVWCLLTNMTTFDSGLFWQDITELWIMYDVRRWLGEKVPWTALHRTR